MGLQNNQNITGLQKNILELEKKYFRILEGVFNTDGFKSDLERIEKEINLDYDNLKRTWNIKNKLKVAAERLVSYHIYKKLLPSIKDIYVSPISSDIGVKFGDCVVCVDCKTVDIIGNEGDAKYIAVETNQISFENSKYPLFKANGKLSQRDRTTRKPVLTYVLKIIYTDDGSQFSIARTQNEGYSSIILACVPNGELSKLFGEDIIANFKTYKYFTAKDNEQLAEVPLNTQKELNDYVEKMKLQTISVENEHGRKKILYVDVLNHITWVYTSYNNQKCLRAIKGGNTMRLNNEMLKNRLDENDNPWLGYKEWDI